MHNLGILFGDYVCNDNKNPLQVLFLEFLTFLNYNKNQILKLYKVKLAQIGKFDENIEMKISHGVVHKIPTDLLKVLLSSPKLQTIWEDITPLARNEWICWVTSPKKLETRQLHIERTQTELIEGKRRPCCWSGCPHR